MNDENIKLLESEIRVELINLSEMEMGSDEYKVSVEELSKLIDKAISLKKMDMDAEDKALDRDINKELKEKQMKIDKDLKEKQMKIDKDLKEKQMKIDKDLKLKQITNEKSDRKLSNIIAIAGIAVPSIITVWGTFKTLKFEETGTVTTIMGRGFINKLLPKKW